MSLASQILARRMRLIEPHTLDVVCQPDLPAEMDDGAILLADRWVAREAVDRPQPTVLIRSPYGRDRFVGLMFGRLLAERGLQVVIQSVRGTFGSGGSFTPFEERADGLATLRWLRQQPWHADRIGMMGPSYLGLVQWAVAPEAGDDLAALAIGVSASQFYGQTYAGGTLTLENTISWMVLVTSQEGRFALFTVIRALRRLRTILDELPVGGLDEVATGAEIEWFREGFSSPGRDDPYWAVRDFSAGVPKVRAPVQFVGGWYDILLPWMLEDFETLQDAGQRPQLRIGPWTHTAPALAAAEHRDSIAFLRAHLLDDDRQLRRSPVRIRLTGERAGGGWRDLESWPPRGLGERRLWLAPGRALSDTAPDDEAGSERYRYDPNDPTPAVGGPVLLAREPVVDNRGLEARPDVVTFTAEALSETVEAVGPVWVELWVKASLDYFDVFARVCDVDPDGASWNVTDALASVAAGRFERGDDGAWHVRFSLWPIGHRFAAGHRIRLQVSSGAHPRYARNLGTGEDPISATAGLKADIELLHDREHPSMLVLPRAG